jgi:hypothetical protein
MPTIHYTNGTSIEYESVTIKANGWVEAHKEDSASHIPAGEIRGIDGVVSYV